MQEIIVYDINGNQVSELVQWDKNVSIYAEDQYIDSAYQVHFFNSGMEQSYVVNSSYDGHKLEVKIPNALLMENKPIIGYINIEKNDENKCLYVFRINVRKKPIPSNYAYVGTNDYINIEDVLKECKEYSKSSLENATKSEDSETNAKQAEKNSKQSELNAKSSETAAKSSQAEAAKSASSAENWSKLAESYVHGNTSMRDNEDLDNAKYYYDNTKKIFENFHDLPEVAYVDKVTGIKNLTWLSDLDWSFATQGSETTNKDKNCKGDNITLRNCDGNIYVCSKGIGTHANSETHYTLTPGEYNAFESLIGVNAEGDACYCNGVKFRIYCDTSSEEKELYRDDNEVFTSTTTAKYIHVDIPDNAIKLRLYVIAVSDTGAAWANWGDAKLISYSDGGCSLENQILDLCRSKVDAKRHEVELGTVEDKIRAKADKDNPVFTGTVSHQRKAKSTAGKYSVVFGYDNKAEGQYGVALGANNDTSGEGAVTLGILNKSTGQGTVSVGMQNQSTRPGAFSEGANNVSSGDAAHSEGVYNIASGAYSHAQGMKNIAAGQAQDVSGRYNVEDTNNKYAHIIGNGTSDTQRSNAHTVDWHGNAEYAGDLIANGCGGENPISLIELEEKVNELHMMIWKELDANDFSYSEYNNKLWSYNGPDNIAKTSCEGHSCSYFKLDAGYTYKIVCDTPQNVENNMQFALIEVYENSNEPYSAKAQMQQGGSNIIKCDTTTYYLMNSTLKSGAKIYMRNF